MHTTLFSLDVTKKETYPLNESNLITKILCYEFVV